MNWDEINAMVDREVRKESEEAGQWTLGELIQALLRFDGEHLVEMQIGGPPGYCSSYRGYYEQLALVRGTKPMKVVDLLLELGEATKITFQGYKGGEFKMTNQSPMWLVESYSRTGERLVGIELQKDRLMLLSTPEN